jgi:hypothetical protein
VITKESIFKQIQHTDNESPGIIMKTKKKPKFSIIMDELERFSLFESSLIHNANNISKNEPTT